MILSEKRVRRKNNKSVSAQQVSLCFFLYGWMIINFLFFSLYFEKESFFFFPFLLIPFLPFFSLSLCLLYTTMYYFTPY